MSPGSLVQDERLEALAREYPRWPGESPLHYAERLAVLAGVMRREDAVVLQTGEELDRRRAVSEREVRLPYKDD